MTTTTSKNSLNPPSRRLGDALRAATPELREEAIRIAAALLKLKHRQQTSEQPALADY